MSDRKVPVVLQLGKNYVRNEVGDCESIIVTPVSRNDDGTYRCSTTYTYKGDHEPGEGHFDYYEDGRCVSLRGVYVLRPVYEPGQTYVTRKGGVVTISDDDGHDVYPLNEAFGLCFTRYGTLYAVDGESEHDLMDYSARVEELPESPADVAGDAAPVQPTLPGIPEVRLPGEDLELLWSTWMSQWSPTNMPSLEELIDARLMVRSACEPMPMLTMIRMI